MCGIAGIVRLDDAPVDRARATAMLHQLGHRGPDGRGITTHGRCALVHTRMAVIDLSGGAQPMRADHGALWVVFNGEIYNHRTLRRQLEAQGCAFTTDHADTEVLLHGYRTWGTRLPERLEGMFAFAIWDDRRQQLFLCRDRIGKKPLYLHRGDRALVFGSLIATVLEGIGSRPGVNAGALRTYLQLGYTTSASLFDGIEELPPAHWMLVDSDGGTRSQAYWQLPTLASTARDPRQAVRDALVQAIDARLEADVPLGCFLSGGIDSSLIAAIAQQRLRQRDSDASLRTFSVAMPDADYDESAHARTVANHIGSRHQQLTIDAASSDVMADLLKLVELSGEPTADSSILPTYWLSRATRAHVNVVLSGDGGDELFVGYERYRAMVLLARHRQWLRLMPGRLLRSDSERALRHRVRRLILASRRASPGEQYRAIVQIFSDRQLSDLGYDAAPLPDWPADLPDDADTVRAAMRWDLGHYLPFDLLRKVDRASMAVALEVRCPMLDTSLCELAGRLPIRVLMPGWRTKGLLRQIARDWLPEPIVNRPKRGFALPIGRWFRTTLREALLDHLLSQSLTNLGLQRQAIESLYNEHLLGRADHTHRLFSLLTLSVWAQRWIGR